MRIALVIERHDASLGAAQRGIFELSAALAKAGARVDILAATGRTQARNIKILFPGRRSARLAEISTAVRDYASAAGCDIIYSTLPIDAAHIYCPGPKSRPEALLRAAAGRSPWVARCKRAAAWLSLRRIAIFRTEKAICRRPDGPLLAAPSHSLADQFRSHYGLSDARIAVIPAAIRVRRNPDVRAVDRLRGQILRQFALQEASNPVIFLFAARKNFRLKGLEPLMRALALAVSRSPCRPPFLVVIGSGKAAHYRLLAARLGISRRVLFLGSIKRIDEALAAVDAAALPVFYDPCSRFVLEALAAGKPVITTSCDGAAERFSCPRHGLVVPSPSDIASLADTLCHYCDESNLRLAQRAIREDDLASAISIDRHVARLLELCESILSRSGSPTDMPSDAAEQPGRDDETQNQSEQER